jgi:putative GTP pyrophosphokinase
MSTDRSSVNEVLQQFDSMKSRLEALCDTTEVLIEQALRAKQIAFQGVHSRVKSRHKIKTKYERADKSYSRLEDLTDLAGLRIVTLLSGDVDKVAEVIRAQFPVHEQHTADKRVVEPDRFGYQSLHYICEYSPQRVALPEYTRFARLRFEVQIRSVFHHVWAELQHGAYDLQKNYPKELTRRYSCLSAVLELADREFAAILEEEAKYARSAAVIVETNAGDLDKIDLNALSLASFAENSQAVKTSDAWLQSLVGVEIEKTTSAKLMSSYSSAANAMGIDTLGALSVTLDKYATVLKAFEEKMLPAWSVARIPKNGLPLGISIYRSLLYLAGKQGIEAVDNMLDAVSVARSNPGFSGQVVAAVKALSS